MTHYRKHGFNCIFVWCEELNENKKTNATKSTTSESESKEKEKEKTAEEGEEEEIHSTVKKCYKIAITRSKSKTTKVPMQLLQPPPLRNT
jgi:hypothetical protein